MNTGYVIESKTKSGRTWSYRKEKNGWSQTASTGIVRQCSGDQLLSHLLPPLAGDQPSLSITVERKNNKIVHRFRRLAQITETKSEEKICVNLCNLRIERKSVFIRAIRGYRFRS